MEWVLGGARAADARWVEESSIEGRRTELAALEAARI